MQQTPAVDKLASRFGNSAIAKQAAQQALLSRGASGAGPEPPASSSSSSAAQRSAFQQELYEEQYEDDFVEPGGFVQLFASQSGISRTSSRYESPRGAAPQPYQPYQPYPSAAHAGGGAMGSPRSVASDGSSAYQQKPSAGYRQQQQQQQQQHGQETSGSVASRAAAAVRPQSAGHSSSQQQQQLQRSGSGKSGLAPASRIVPVPPAGSSSNSSRRPLRTTSGRTSAGGGSITSTAATLVTASRDSSETGSGAVAGGASGGGMGSTASSRHPPRSAGMVAGQASSTPSGRPSSRSAGPPAATGGSSSPRHAAGARGSISRTGSAARGKAQTATAAAAAAQAAPSEEEELLEVLHVLHAKSAASNQTHGSSRAAAPHRPLEGRSNSPQGAASSVRGRSQSPPRAHQQQQQLQQGLLVQGAAGMLQLPAEQGGQQLLGRGRSGFPSASLQHHRSHQQEQHWREEEEEGELCMQDVPASLAPIRTSLVAPGHQMNWQAQQQQQQHQQQQPMSPAEKEAQAEAFFEAWRLRRHHPETPDYKYSQAAAEGPLAPVKQQLWNFDQAHPAFAEQHYLRTHEQNRIMEQLKSGMDPSTPQQTDPASPTWRPNSRFTAGAAGADVARAAASSSPLARSCSSPVAWLAWRGSAGGARGGSRRGTAVGMSMPTSPSIRQQARTQELVTMMRASLPTGLSRASSGIPSTRLSKSPVRAHSRGVTAHSAAEEAINASRHLTRRMSSSNGGSRRRSGPTSISAVMRTGSGAVAGAGNMALGGLRSLSPEDRQYISSLEAKVDLLQRSLQLLVGSNDAGSAAAAGSVPGGNVAAMLAAAAARGAVAGGQHQGADRTGLRRPASAAAGAAMGELSEMIQGLNQAGAEELLQSHGRAPGPQAAAAAAQQWPALTQQSQRMQRPAVSSPRAGSRPSSAASTAAAAAGGARAAGPSSTLSRSASPDLEYVAKKEILIATGAFDPERYQAYEQQMQELMERRSAARATAPNSNAADAGYDSDLEREYEAEKAAVAADAKATAAEANRKLREEADKEAALAAAWEEENAWMDAYRGLSRGAEEEGEDCHGEGGSDGEHSAGSNSRRRRQRRRSSTSSSSDDGAEGSREERKATAAVAAHQRLLEDARAAAAGHGLSDMEELLVQQPFVPLVSPDFPQYAVMSDAYHAVSDNEASMRRTRGTWERTGSSGYTSDGPGDGRLGYSRHSLSSTAAPFKTTIPAPFTFEERAKVRPKTIAAVKLEQDLELKRQAIDAVINSRFRAKPVPPSTTEPRYETIIAEQEAKRAAAHDTTVMALASMEAPFSFYYRDREAAAAKEAAAAAARDPNRFQRRFKANPVPPAVKEQVFSTLHATWEAKRVAALVKQQLAREKARARLEEHYRARQAAAAAAYTERLMESADMSAPRGRSRSRSQAGTSTSRTSSADAQTLEELEGRLAAQRHRTLSPHARHVPDFHKLHDTWHRRLATAKATNKRRVTVPQEFLLNGSTPEQQAVRAAKTEERRQRILQDIARDQEQLPELRWPYKSTRAAVKPTPPPAAAELEGAQFAVGETLAARLRAEVVRKAMRSGQYDTSEEREQRSKAAAAREMTMRAQRWAALQEEALWRRQRDTQHLQELQDGTEPLDNQAGAATAAHTLGASLRSSGQLMQTGRGLATLERRMGLTQRKEAPLMHIEARHQQAQEQARALVEEALLQQGIAAYRYVEG